MDTILRGWIENILQQRAELLAIAIRQRAKFEGWLKFELAAYAESHGATLVQVEFPYAGAAALCRSDLTFSFHGLRYDVELKTPNTNWRLGGVLNTTRPITQNMAEIVKDGRKLAGCAGRGLIALVLFPVPPQDQRWTKYLQRLAAELNVPLSVQDHATQMTVPLGDGNAADVVICCFAIPPLEFGSEEGHSLRPIPRHWLVHRLAPSDRTFSTAVDQLRPLMQAGDELWFYDELTPPDVNAGELGIALVRDGNPIHGIIEGVH